MKYFWIVMEFFYKINLLGIKYVLRHMKQKLNMGGILTYFWISFLAVFCLTACPAKDNAVAPTMDSAAANVDEAKKASAKDSQMNVVNSAESMEPSKSEEVNKAPAQDNKVVLTEKDFQIWEKDPKILKLGAKTFKAFCVVCHGKLGEGLVGPNLTDKFWIHGKGQMTDIYHTIQVGVPDKGMVAWRNTLPDGKIQALTVFVKSLAGSNPPNAKAAEGN